MRARDTGRNRRIGKKSGQTVEHLFCDQRDAIFCAPEAPRVVVMVNGRLVADGEPAAVIASPIVQQAYLGVAPAGEGT